MSGLTLRQVEVIAASDVAARPVRRDARGLGPDVRQAKEDASRD
jgi:hypothetical protein